jgi:hypothetical protein
VPTPLTQPSEVHPNKDEAFAVNHLSPDRCHHGLSGP